MNAGQLNLKARRTTRIPLRIPVVLVIEENGTFRSTDAWTMIVNVHGARIECKRPFPLHQEILIQVPSSGMSEKGKVVWNKTAPNEHSAYEIVVELNRPENLWGLGFPPWDWEAPLTTQNAEMLPYGSVSEFDSLQMLSLEEEIPMLNPEPAERSAAETRAPSCQTPDTQRADREHLFPLSDAAHPTSPPVAGNAGLGTTPPSDRLSVIFNELVESALQTRVLSLVERLGEKIEARVAEIEANTLDRVEQRIRASASSQCEALEERVLSLVATQQQLLEQNVQWFLADVETKAQQRQHEFLEESRQAMRTEVGELVASCNQRLERETGELVESTQASLQQKLEEQLPPMEKEMLERCRGQAERLLAGQLEQWTLLFSDRLQEAQQTASLRVEASVEEAAARHAASLESRSEELCARSSARLEEQLGRIGTQVRQAFLRHIVTELNRSEQHWTEKAQQQMEGLAEQNLQWTRRHIALVMKNFGEGLLRQAYLEAGAPADVSSPSGSEQDAQPTEGFDHAPVAPNCS